METLIYICVGALLVLLWLLRVNRVSLGLPFVYLFSLLLIHVPGAYAHLVGEVYLVNTELIERAMTFTAIGSACFVAGVWLSRLSVPNVVIRPSANNLKFWLFCLTGGWIMTYGLTPLYRIPSVAAAVQKGGAIWMLGVLLGLRSALARHNLKWTGLWLGAMMVYPVLMLLLGGFVSYGSTAVIVVLSGLAITTRSYLKILVSLVVFVIVGFSFFVTYYKHRDDIRDQVWGGRSLDARIASVQNMIDDFQWFDSSKEDHLVALDQRLNQNYFVGLAAERIDLHEVNYLNGRSIWDGVLSLVPRIIWPDKPVVGGSGTIVAEMTGLILNESDTSFGVGNVMEFQINFGIPGIIFGFLILGWGIGTLDMKAAVAEAEGDFGRCILYFLPGVALIQPNGSVVELCGGAAAALVAAVVWKTIWDSRIRSIDRVGRKRRESVAFGNESLA